jgi:Holliday junction resolvase RusA-like endonuclease
MLFEMSFEGHPVSVNNAFPTSRSGHRFPSVEYKAFQARMAGLLRGRAKIDALHGPLSVEIELHAADWFTQGGGVRKKDLANYEKTLIDTVFKILGLHDALIFDLRMRKVIAVEKKTVLRVFDLGAF